MLIAWRQTLPPPEQQREDERELAMNLEQVYERWERKVKAEGRREGKAEGKASGKAEGVLAVLGGRGLGVTAAQRRQVLACTDEAQLDTWLRTAGTTPSAAALLSGSSVRRPRAR
jgi:flagellar biosynthesis/type III secretory pathway protein FliH